MPLNRQQALTHVFNAFNDAIRTPSCLLQWTSQSIHRLMMKGIDLCFLTVYTSQHAFFSRRDGMGRHFFRNRSLHMNDLTEGTDVLLQRAPKGHVDQLHPPTNRKNWFLLQQRFIDQRQFKLIPCQKAASSCLMGLLPIKLG